MRLRACGFPRDPRLAQPRRRPARPRADGLAPGRRGCRMSFMDVPPGKIAAVVTSLEMPQRPAPRPEAPNSALVLQHVIRPEPAWYRNLFRSVGENWLW